MKAQTTVSLQARVNHATLAELALFFEKKGFHRPTKSALINCVLENFANLLRQNGLSEPIPIGEAAKIFKNLGYGEVRTGRNFHALMEQESLVLESLTPPTSSKVDQLTAHQISELVHQEIKKKVKQ